jgi:hypothetical protein
MRHSLGSSSSLFALRGSKQSRERMLLLLSLFLLSSIFGCSLLLHGSFCRGFLFVGGFGSGLFLLLLLLLRGSFFLLGSSLFFLGSGLLLLSSGLLLLARSSLASSVASCGSDCDRNEDT